MGDFKAELRKDQFDNFILTLDELKDLILKSYNDGYNDCKLKIKIKKQKKMEQ